MTQLVPIFICAIMPISIVLIVALSKMNNSNKRANVIMKALEVNNNIDVDKLAESFREPVKTPQEILQSRLLRGCIFSFIGIVLIVAGLINFWAGGTFDDDAVSVTMLFGGCSLAIGLSYLVVYFVSRKQIDADKDK